MSWRDKLKNAQSGGATVMPQFTKEIKTYYEMKQDEDNSAGFMHVVDKQKHFVKKAIKGILIGKNAMQYSVFDAAQNDSYKSTIFFTKKDDSVVFFKGQKVFSGTAEECGNYMAQKAGNRVKNTRLLFVLTRGGLIQVGTNLTLSIDNEKKLKDADGSMVVLTPKMYSKSDTSIAQKTHDTLKLAAKNPPAWVEITVSKEEITDAIANDINLEHYLDLYAEFVDFVKKGKQIEVKEQPVAHGEFSEQNFAEHGDDEDVPF